MRRTRTDSLAVAPVVTMSSTTSTSPLDRLGDLDAAGDVALAIGARQADGVADHGPHPQRLGDVDAGQVGGGRPRHPGDRIAAAAPGSRSPGRRGHDGQRCADHTPDQQALQPGSQRDGQRRDQVGAAVLLDRDDRFAARPGIATERQHRHARIDARGDQVGFVGLHGQLASARIAPSGRRCAAAAALERKDKVKHSVSVATLADIDSGYSEAMQDDREAFIVDCLVQAFSDLMEADPDAFRTKFRKMAADPFAFYRGSACVFYADAADREDRWADERTSRVWIQGDLHAENFGTYMDGAGVLIFDVNDFDEAFVGHFTWDLQRFAASVALMCWQKALSDEEISKLIATFVHAYIEQVQWFVKVEDDASFSLNLDTARGAVLTALQEARLSTRAEMLDHITTVDDWDRRFRDAAGVRRLDDAERDKVEDAFDRYLETIPKTKQFRGIAYDVKDLIGKTGFGIGSAGLPSYSVLIEGFNQALDNDIVLSMKQGNVAAPSRIITDANVHEYFKHHGHRTAVSQRALQAHADPLLGYTDIDGVGFVVSELSPLRSRFGLE